MSSKPNAMKVVKSPNATTTVKKIKEFVTNESNLAMQSKLDSAENWIKRPTRRDRDNAIIAQARLELFAELDKILG